MIEIVFAAAAYELGPQATVGFTPLAAVILLVPAVAHRRPYALACALVVVAAWAIGFAALGSEWEQLGWSLHGYGHRHEPVGSEASWCVPITIALLCRAALERDAWARVGGVVGVVALLVFASPPTLELNGNNCAHLFEALALVAVARAVARACSVRDGAGDASIAWNALAVAAAAVQVGLWLSTHTWEQPAVFVVGWARVATCAAAGVVALEAARRAGLSSRGLVVGAVAIVPALALAVTATTESYVASAIADAGGSLPAPLRLTYDLGDWAMSTGGFAWLAVASSAPFLLVAIAQRRTAGVVLHASRIALCAVLPLCMPRATHSDTLVWHFEREPWIVLVTLPLFALALLPPSTLASLLASTARFRRGYKTTRAVSAAIHSA